MLDQSDPSLVKKGPVDHGIRQPFGDSQPWEGKGQRKKNERTFLIGFYFSKGVFEV